MSKIFSLRANLALLAILIGVSSPISAGEKNTRTFEAQQVRYTLPGPEWAWSDQKKPDMLFAAFDEHGYAVTVAVVGPTKPLPFDQRFISEYEQSMFPDRRHRKRSSRLITFHGLPAYQVEGVLEDGRTTINRVFFANGSSYLLAVIGGEKPIENDPKFDAMIQGFEFTEPPAQINPPDQRSKEEKLSVLANKLGSIGVYLLFGVAILMCISARSRRSKTTAPSDSTVQE